MTEKISAIIIVYNEEKVIENCLKSIKGVVDEILIAHDGKCTDNTLKICKKYTNKIFVRPHKGRSAFHWIYLIKKAKYDWILKLDADEFLSKDLNKDLQRLAQNKDALAYSFIWPWWDKEKNKYATHNWPRKTSLYRKSKISGVGFPAWDTPIVHGQAIRTNYILEHRPLNGSIPNWSNFKSKAIDRYCKGQARYTLMPLSSFERYNYNKKDFPLQMRLRREYPVLTAVPFSILAFIKTLFSDNAWREGNPVLLEAVQTSIYYLFLGYFLHRLKSGKDI